MRGFSLVATALLGFGFVSPLLGQPTVPSASPAVHLSTPTPITPKLAASELTAPGSLPASIRPALPMTALPLASLSSSHSPSATAVDARDVACSAGQNWMPAIQLKTHAKSLEDLYCGERDACTRQAVQAISLWLRLQAERQQDVGAAAALRAYYTLAAIKLQQELVAVSQSMLNSRREQQDQLMQQGAAAAMDLTSFDREQIALNLRQLQLEQSVSQLSQSLNELTRSPDDWSAAGLEPLEIRAAAVETLQLTHLAMANRQDLIAFRELKRRISTDSAPLLVNVIAGSTGMISLPLPKSCWWEKLLGRAAIPSLAGNLKQQVSLATDALAQSIRQAVAEKSSALGLGYQEVELAEATLASWQQRMTQLERLAELGDSRPAELAEADSSQLASKASLVETKLRVKLAEVELAETCGCLHARCCRGEAWLELTGP